MSAKVIVSDSAMQRALYELATATKKPFSFVVRRQARLIAVELARFTMPIGLASSRRPAEKAVYADVNRVYAKPWEAYDMIKEQNPEIAKAFWKYFEDKNWKEVRKIMREHAGSWNGVPVQNFKADFHKKARGSNGKVPKGVKPSQVVMNPKRIDSYAQKKVRMVGFAKGGWAAAAKQIGGMRGIPQWVTRHAKQGIGRAIDNSEQEGRPHVVLINEVRYIESVCTPSTVRQVMASHRHKMMKHVNIVLSKATEKFNNT